MSTTEMVDHPWLGDAEGHNCFVCDGRQDSLHLCWREAHTPDAQFEWFVRQVVEAISRYQDDGKGGDITDEQKVGAAMRMSWVMHEADPGWWREENVTYTAALIVAGMTDRRP